MMIRVLLTCLALAALASPSRAATLMACQDTNGSDWPVSPQHPCPFQATGTAAGTSDTSAQAVQGITGGVPVTVAAPLGTYANGSVTLSTSAAQIYAASSGVRYRIVLLNYDATNDIWCRWGTVGGAPASVSGAGSFKVAANGGGRDDNGPGVNQSAVNCIASAGTPILYAEQY